MDQIPVKHISSLLFCIYNLLIIKSIQRAAITAAASLQSLPLPADTDCGDL